MPPNKRAQRGRVNKEVDNTADSSPSRPVKRRKKADPAEEQALPRTQDEIQMDDEDIVVAAIQVLAMPEHPVAAALDHANTVHEQHNSTGVQAYAKLAGKDWTFYIKKLRINIGRPPEAPNTPVEHNGDTDSDPEAEDSKTHVNLGPSKMVSRDHAQVYYEGEAEKWYILINGRNGIRLDGEQRRRGEIIALVSGEVIEIGGVEMMFVLPHDGSLKINKTFLIRANLITDNQNEQNGVHNPAAPGPPMALHQFPQAQAGGYNGPQPIAPAPPNYHRPGTPNSAQQNLYNSNQTYIQPSYKNSPNFNGTMVMHGDDVDLALDSNQHIKPAFSYAQLIAQAILESPEEKITLSGIYDFITKNWAYYRWQPAGGWQNSIRHNLSLNKAFTKVARSTEEPGKGMKWIIQPEAMDDMRRNAHRSGRGGHRGSSAPSSPAILSQGYVDHNSKVMAGENELGSAQKGSPRSGSPHMSSSFPLTGPQFTPDRGRQLLTSFQDHLRNNNSRSNSHTNSHNSNSHHNLPNSQHHHHQLPGDGSPLPRNRRPQPPSAFGFSDNIPGSPPVLSSSYQQEDNSFVTPAPHRHFPRLAPPSTAQKPSEVMPTSSPAPFWKYADLTPRKGSHFESSPIKPSTAPSAVPPSSSPPPTHLASPTRIGPSAMKRELLEDLDEDEGFDLTKPFQSIGEYHATSGQPVAPLHGR